MSIEPREGMTHFDAVDGERIRKAGVKSVKKLNPVWLVQLEQACEVETDSGVLHAEAGSYLAHDPISGHVWPVTAEYVEQHYDDVTPRIPFDGTRFVKALEAAGILPDNTVRVRIDAEVNAVPTISYTVFADQRLLELVDGIDTSEEKPAH